MFDLVSTREDVDPQTVRSAQLLAAVIADAVRNASVRPSKQEQDEQRNIDASGDGAHPGLSTWFLFDDASPFTKYARLIGIDPQGLRDALLSDRPLRDDFSKAGRSMFTFSDRRAIKARHSYYIREKHANEAAKKDQPQGASNGI